MKSKLRFLYKDGAYKLIEGDNSRGFYHIYTFLLDKKEDESEWRYMLDVSEKLALVMVDISAARDRALNDEEIKKLERILIFFEENGYGCIVRAVYDRVGEGVKAEPDSLITVLKHIDQLGAVAYRHSANILTWQGLLVGSWGEMHSSKFMSPDNLVLMYDRFREATKGEVILSVRRLDMIDIIKSEHPDDKIGLFNDGILGDETDLGTFDKGDRQNFLDRVAKVAAEAPVGGELAGVGETEQTTVDYLRGLHLTYLNSAYNPKYLQILGMMRCPGKNINILEYLKKSLGYNIMISPDGLCVNAGMAKPYDELTMEIYDAKTLEFIKEMTFEA